MHLNRRSVQLRREMWLSVAYPLAVIVALGVLLDTFVVRTLVVPALFTLVGAHGLHVAAGLVWLTVMIGQVATLGFTDAVERRLLCFGLYWHALDIIWVALFTVVYLLGAGA